MNSSLRAFVRRWKDRLSRPVTAERVTRYVRSRWPALLGGAPSNGPASVSGRTESPGGYSSDYATWIRHRVQARKAIYSASVDPQLFTILTPVYNTPPEFLWELAESVFAQDYPFQWAVVDDGSSDPRTLQVVDRIAQDPRVVCVKLPKNLGITGATRAAFELATGRYIVPVDADDLLYPDSLRVMASCLEQADWPAFAYSDEDKVFGDSRPVHPFFKPDWDPVLFLNCCYIAHLCAISREVATAVNVYSDHEARGCPDLDSFCRILATGREPLHVPEVLYSWRIHSGSTSSAENRAKPYTISCQKHVWSQHLQRLAPDVPVELRTNPLFGNVGMWYPARRPEQPGPVQVNILIESNATQLEQCLAAVIGDRPDPGLSIRLCGTLSPAHERLCESLMMRLGAERISVDPLAKGYQASLRSQLEELSAETLVVTMTDQWRLKHEGWLWDLRGIFDVYAEAAVVTPRLLDVSGLVASAGEHFGFDGLSGAPDIGRGPQDSGYHGWVFCQRSVSAPAVEFHACRASFLQQALPQMPAVSRRMLAPWLGLLARRLKQRVVYTPFVTAQQITVRSQPALQPHLNEWFDFAAQAGDAIACDPYYSRFLQLQRGRGFDLALPSERAAQLNGVLFRLEGPQDWYNIQEATGRDYVEPNIGDQLRKADPAPDQPRRLPRAA